MSKEIIMVKHGSSSNENDNGIGTDQSKVNSHARNHNWLRREGFDTIETASGAVVEGKEYLFALGAHTDDYNIRELALHGTAGQVSHWQKACEPYGIPVGQVLATHDEIDDDAEGKAIISNMLSATRRGSLILLNENNAASTLEMDEYEKSSEARRDVEFDAEPDCDLLAAHAAKATGASVLLLLSNIDGLMVKGEVRKEVKTYDVLDMLPYCIGKSRSGSKDGMKSKLLAAKKAAEAGMLVIIGNAFVDTRYLLSGDLGTRVIQ